MTLPHYALDIETNTEHCETHNTNCGLNPDCAGVTEAVVYGDGVSEVFDNSHGETALLTELSLLLSKLPAGVVDGWNSHVFDLPYLSRRSQLTGVDMGLVLAYDASIPVKYDPLPGFLGGYRALVGPHRHLDICHYYKGVADELGVKYSLKPVGRALGLDPIEVDRENMHLLSPEERRAYVTSDGRITYELARRIPEHEFLRMLDVVTAP